MCPIKHFIYACTSVALTSLAPIAQAEMLINFKSSIMQWQEEHTDYTGNNEFFESTFFTNEEIQLDVTFITPDFELATGQNQYHTFYDPVVKVKTSNFFDLFTIDGGGHFWLELTSDETIQMWSFSFNITDTNNPAAGTTRRGEFSSFGWFTSVNEGYGSGDQLMFYQDNWPYVKQGNIWNSNTVARFAGEDLNSKMTIEKISVPEPSSITLFLTGLIFYVVLLRSLQRPPTRCVVS